jgi:gp16 family phage-associated protein
MTHKADQVKARFRAYGVTLADWSRERGFNVMMVYRVLSGKVKGTRGEAHRIAIALGLKPAPYKVKSKSIESLFSINKTAFTKARSRKTRVAA